jgi:hypothetical protein
MAGNVIRMNEGWRMNEGHRMDEPPVVTPVVPPPVHRKRGNTMVEDYVPNKRGDRYNWYQNLSDNVVAEAVKMGAPPADATAIKAVADGIIAKFQATTTAQGAVDAARLIEGNTEAAGLPQIRARIKNWKTLPGYANSGSEGVLQLRGSAAAIDPLSHKSVIKLHLVPGGVRVDFTKKGVTAVNIYMRVSGTGDFNKIGMDTESPYTDTTPLAQPGKPEVREYMVQGLLHDEEIGMPSAVERITFAG